MSGRYSKSQLQRFGVAERTRVRQTLASLTDQQWNTPSLCEGWTVRHVAAHLAANSKTSPAGFATRMAKSGFDIDAANRKGADEWAARPTGELLDALSGDGMPVTIRFMPFLLVVDTVVHHQDIRRPLGLGRDIPPDHLVAALEAVTTEKMFAPFAKGVSGLRLVASDVDWTWGTGPQEVHGPGEALLLAVMGRKIPGDELAGPGTTRLESVRTE